MERRERASGAARRDSRARRAEDAEPRSDAPKSIAGSLLVPADMLPASVPASSGASDPTDRAPGADMEEAESGPDAQSLRGEGHPNPFLVPAPADSGDAGKNVRSSRHRTIAAPITRLTGWIRAQARTSLFQSTRHDWLAPLRRRHGVVI